MDPSRLPLNYFERTVTWRQPSANNLLMDSGERHSDAARPVADLNRWMERYQAADPEAPKALVWALSPPLLRFFRSQTRSYEQADDLLQETWLRIHRVRHTYRPGEPVLPWVYAIARRVGVDGYRRTRRVSAHETPMEVLPERPEYRPPPASLPDFETLVAGLPEAQREVITLLKVGGLSLEEVACATSSSVGAVKQKAHRAYERLRAILAARPPRGLTEEAAGGNR
jgi:RNA polymerase sigma-70 factor (ECF subfamily)